MKLLVDNREPIGIIELLKVRVQNIELNNLEIGDFIIKNDNDEIIMIFERKSISDLIASIKDGRYNEQSFRLSQLPLPNHYIYYIIEGNMNDFIIKNNEQTRKMVFSAMLSLSYTKGFSLLHGNGWLDTAEFIIRFMEKLDKLQTGGGEKPYVETIINEASPIPQLYSQVIKTSKKSYITKDNIGEIMLAQIPGLSVNVAQAIMSEFKTIKNLIKALENNTDCLDNLLVECKNGKRKINKPVIKNIKEFLI